MGKTAGCLAMEETKILFPSVVCHVLRERRRVCHMSNLLKAALSISSMCPVSWKNRKDGQYSSWVMCSQKEMIKQLIGKGKTSLELNPCETKNKVLTFKPYIADTQHILSLLEYFETVRKILSPESKVPGTVHVLFPLSLFKKWCRTKMIQYPIFAQ